MLRRWLDTSIVCAKPNGEDANFGQIRFITLRDTLSENIWCYRLQVCCRDVITLSNIGRLHSVL